MDRPINIDLTQRDGYRFEVVFQSAGAAPLATDAPRPVGEESGPNSEELLLAAVANCLASSLLFSLRKYGNEPGPIEAFATATLVRNQEGLPRIGGIGVRIKLGAAASSMRLLDRAVDQFEDHCVVTESVRTGIPVLVRVEDRHGIVLKA
jgi:organic hydroperoxide reductase OsmC/OhrA